MANLTLLHCSPQCETCPSICTSHVSYYSTVLRLYSVRKQKPYYNFKQRKFHIKTMKLWSESNCRNVKWTLGLMISVQRKPKLAGECLPKVGFRPHWRVSSPMSGNLLDCGEVGQFAQAKSYPQLLSKSGQPSMLQTSQQWWADRSWGIIAGTRLECAVSRELPESSPQAWAGAVRSLRHCALGVWLGQSTHVHTVAEANTATRSPSLTTTLNAPSWQSFALNSLIKRIVQPMIKSRDWRIDLELRGSKSSSS